MFKWLKPKNKTYKPAPQDFAVIGLGRFGSSLAVALAQSGHTVLGVDRNPDLVQEMADHLTHTIGLDATDEDALKEAGLHLFDTVVVAIGADFESNLMTTVALKALGTRRVICKAMTDRQRTILLRVGADQVILPEIEAGQRLAQDLVAPTIFSRLYLSETYGVVERRVPDAMAGKTLAEVDLRNQFGVSVLVVSRDTALFVSPAGDFQMAENDVLVLLGSNADLGRFNAAY